MWPERGDMWFLVGFTEHSTHHFCGIPIRNAQPERNHEQTSDKPEQKYVLHRNWSESLNHVQLLKMRKALDYRRQETHGRCLRTRKSWHNHVSKFHFNIHMEISSLFLAVFLYFVAVLRCATIFHQWLCVTWFLAHLIIAFIVRPPFCHSSPWFFSLCAAVNSF